jgi:hypothetical protein
MLWKGALEDNAHEIGVGLQKLVDFSRNTGHPRPTPSAGEFACTSTRHPMGCSSFRWRDRIPAVDRGDRIAVFANDPHGGSSGSSVAAGASSAGSLLPHRMTARWFRIVSETQGFAFCLPPARISSSAGASLLPVRLRPRRHQAVERAPGTAAMLTCGQEAWLEGFTVSEFDPAKLLTAAVIDQARKHRKRPPDEDRRIAEHRRVRPR